MSKNLESELSSFSARTSLVIAIAVAIAAVGVVLAFQYSIRSQQRADLPRLPDLSGRPHAVADHLRGRFAEAERNPASAAAVGALCLALHADMFYADAERCYPLARRLDAIDWRWLYFDALLQSERGGGRAFADALRVVLSKAPDFGPAWLRLGEAEFKEGHDARAEEAWRHAQMLPEPARTESDSTHTADVPVTAYAELGLARVALARGEVDAARRLLEHLTDTSPGFGSAFRLLAESDTRLGRSVESDRARARANQLPAFAPYADPMIDVLAADSRNSTFLLRQASEADLATNAAWSEHLIRRALEFDPENPDVLSKLGRVLRTLGRNQEALDYFIAYNRMVPGDFQGLANIGSCLSDLERPEEAEDYLRRALAGIDDALTHYNLGVVLAATGRIEQALGEYGRALERDPMDLRARNNLAVALARQGRVNQAVAQFKRVLTLDPANRMAAANLEALAPPRSR